MSATPGRVARRAARPLRPTGAAPGERARAALRVPFARRARRELGYAVAGAVPAVAGFALVTFLLAAGAGLTVTLLGAVPGLLVLVLTPGLARRLGALHRWLARRALGGRFAAPPPFRPGRGCSAGSTPGCATARAGEPLPTRWSSFRWRCCRRTRPASGLSGSSTWPARCGGRCRGPPGARRAAVGLPGRAARAGQRLLRHQLAAGPAGRRGRGGRPAGRALAAAGGHGGRPLAGAAPARPGPAGPAGTRARGGSGLPGLVQRVRTVDGRLHLASPPGGPTVVTVELPLRA
jgi:hypothetical protein